MKTWDKLVDLLTDRLRVDPELRLDVAEELRAHLEDSAAEFRQAGQSDEEAVASAAKALGDPQQLADELWQANRRRIRIRGVLRWGSRVALVPGAILVILILMMGLVEIFMPVNKEGYISASWLEGLSEEQRFVLESGSPLMLGTEAIEAAKSITDRWPNNPVYYGNYVAQMYTWGEISFDEQPNVDRLKKILAVLDKGERIDPDNAFYNFTKAAWLVLASSDVSKDTTRTYDMVNQEGKLHQISCWKIEIHDLDLFKRALAEFKVGLGKGEFTTRAADMIELRGRLLPEPRGLQDYMRQQTLAVVVAIPPLGGYKKLARSVLAHAIDLAVAGQHEESVDLVDGVELMAAKLGSRARDIVDLLLAHSIRLEGLGHAQCVYKEMGLLDQAQFAQEVYSQAVTQIRKVISSRALIDENQLRHAGVFDHFVGLITRFPPGYTVDFEPRRTAEQFVAAEIGLLLSLCLLVLLALLLGGLALVSLIIQRPGNKPILLFVGWSGIGKICLLAIVVPVAVYALYAYVLTASDRVYGLNYTAGKTLLEFVVTLGAICVLLLGLGYSAVRRRAEEIGLVVPPALRLRDRRWIACVGALIALAVVVYLVGWWAGPFKPKGPRLRQFDSIHGAFLAIAVVAFLLFWGLREFAGLYWRKCDHFRRTLYRSLVPIIAAAVIVVGIFCGWALARGESSAAKRITGSSAMDFCNELERSDFRLFRENFIAQHTEMMNRQELGTRD